MTEKKHETEEQVVQEVKETESNPLVIGIDLKKPIEVDGMKIEKVTLDFTNMTGADILSVDKEMRMEGHATGFDNIFNQEVQLKLASRASGLLPDDLTKLHGAEFLEVVLQTRNFFIQW